MVKLNFGFKYCFSFLLINMVMMISPAFSKAKFEKKLHTPPVLWSLYEINNKVLIDSFCIEIWYGKIQKTGQFGNSQHDFNLLGHVHSKNRIISLAYTVNGGVPHPLYFATFRRIVVDNDFNADIPVSSLKVGKNDIFLRAVDIEGNSSTASVSVERMSGKRCSIPMIVHWSKVRNLEEVGQCTDGKWSISSKGLRTMQVGYDRVFVVGDTNWKDYEVKCKVTINNLSEKNGPQSWTVKHAGFCLRWSGHSSEENQIGDQPKWGLHPRGGIVWLTFRNGKFPPVRQFYPGDSENFQTFEPFEIVLGKSFWMKGRCQTLADSSGGSGVTKYSFKVWNIGSGEPHGWDFEVRQVSVSALRTGSLALVAHETDVTFGDIFITSLFESPVVKSQR